MNFVNFVYTFHIPIFQFNFYYNNHQNHLLIVVVCPDTCGLLTLERNVVQRGLKMASKNQSPHPNVVTSLPKVNEPVTLANNEAITTPNWGI